MMVTAGSRYGLLGLGLLSVALTALGASSGWADLFLSNRKNTANGVASDSIAQYSETDGTLLNDYPDGNLSGPNAILFGPDGNLYVGNGSRTVLRFDNQGNLIDVFVNGGTELNGPRGMIFGPDGNLYVSSKSTNSVERYSGVDGSYIDDFVPPTSGGLSGPRGIVFGPDRGDGVHDLFVASFGDVSPKTPPAVLRYDGLTGDFIEIFASDAQSGVSGLPLKGVNGITFGPDGNLYVTNANTDSVIRYDGTTGLAMDTNGFVQSGTSPLSDGVGILFGPDGNLYVADLNDRTGITGGGVMRYDGTTGDFIDQFIPPDYVVFYGGSYMTFTKTDPVTLQYIKGP
jgi:glucose/arabinose dehydrogenase